jgi:4-aminobutyrate aminotransferase-like enzyme
MDTAAIAALRSKHMGGNLSLHYAPEPLHIVRGEGAHLFDSEGRKYIDLSNNVAHVGHSHPAVVAAAHAQLSTLNTNTRYHNEVYVRYAAELAALFPDPLSVVFLVNSGSEANDLALRLARAHTGGSDVICLDHAYHGHTQACIDVSPYKFNGKGGRGRPPHTHVTICPDPYRGVFRPEPAAGDAAADESENTAVGAAFAADVARICNGLAPAPGPSASPAGAVPPPASLCAFIAESYLGCGGQIALAPGYLQAAYAAVRAKSGVCIADEVQVRSTPRQQGILRDCFTLYLTFTLSCCLGRLDLAASAHTCGASSSRASCPTL